MGYTGELGADQEILCGDSKILIYGVGSYGDKIYRGLTFYQKEKKIEAFIDKKPSKQGELFHDIPIISIENAMEKYGDMIVCIGGETEGNIRDLELLEGIQNIHQIVFNRNCNLYGTQYGGFYLPKDFAIEDSVIYSFGIGEDLSFSEVMIDRGGVVYAFDPTPKAVKFVENHRLFSNPRFHFFPYGLSDKNGKENFYLPAREDWVSASVVLHQYVNDKNTIEVEMKTLRSIMRELDHDHIDILKMDIEGAEFKVIEDIMNPDSEAIDFQMCLMETHERFFPRKEGEYVSRLYHTMTSHGFYDLYGTDKEPTFIKK